MPAEMSRYQNKTIVLCKGENVIHRGQNWWLAGQSQPIDMLSLVHGVLRSRNMPRNPASLEINGIFGNLGLILYCGKGQLDLSVY